MVLECGIYNNARMAEWFGIKEKTFSNTKRQRLKELEEYAQFYEDKRRIIITRVLQPIYIKKTSANFKRVADLVLKTWSDNGFDTCKNVSEKIKNDERLSKLSDATRYEYVRRAHNITHGSPAKQNGGTLGMCKYKWGKRDKDCSTQPLYFSPEENEYFHSLIREVFRDDPETIAFKQALRQAMKKNEISKSEYYEQIDAIEEEQEGKWVLIEQGMYNKFGIELIRGTQEEFKKAWEVGKN